MTLYIVMLNHIILYPLYLLCKNTSYCEHIFCNVKSHHIMTLYIVMLNHIILYPLYLLCKNTSYCEHIFCNVKSYYIVNIIYCNF
jgi:riboflavin transporter FmnP